MTTLIIDGRRMKTRDKAHEYLSRKKGFPKEYGRNLDALYDVLTSLNDVKIKVRYSASFEKNLGIYGYKLLEVIRDADAHNGGITLEID